MPAAGQLLMQKTLFLLLPPVKHVIFYLLQKCNKEINLVLELIILKRNYINSIIFLRLKRRGEKNLPKNFCGVDLLRLVMLTDSLSTKWIFSLDGCSTGLETVSILTDSSTTQRRIQVTRGKRLELLNIWSPGLMGYLVMSGCWLLSGGPES